MKFKKIFTKSLFFVPCYIILVVLFNWIFKKNFDPVFLFLIVIVASIITTLSNVFDYDYFNDIEPKDYLESRHKTSIDYDKSKWKKLENLENIIPYKQKLIDKTDTRMEYLITFNFLKGQLNTALIFTHNNNKIDILIEKKPFSFLPDKSRNYRIIRRIMNKLKN
ncbi:hypothetical protein GCM10011414_00690 [Croceivirga lutea]|uniref:hypothetical protein n=1 Tax=Croceivirga lutea TaxID=1775167 RepID=UPI00163AB63A|nr:hypothetical protein [Croceivirga lutea]GGG35149.1 hypothetical protein GCM10011414_00690 [Croceivirga lutea]